MVLLDQSVIQVQDSAQIFPIKTAWLTSGLTGQQRGLPYQAITQIVGIKLDKYLCPNLY